MRRFGVFQNNQVDLSQPAPDCAAMRCTCYRTDPATLVSWLTDVTTLERYQQALDDEGRALADKTLADHLRRMSRIAMDVRTAGFEVLARRDLPGADELLTDIFAVATWQRWDGLPVEDLGTQDLPVDDLPRGLLAADAGIQGASLWQLDGATLALARTREADQNSAEPCRSC